MFFITASCSGTPTKVVDDSLPDLLTPNPGMAKIIVYSPRSYVWSNTTANISLGGQTGCKLRNGTYALYNATPGKMVISTALCNGNSISSLSLQVEPDKKYFLQVIPNDESLTGRIAGYGIPTTKNPPQPIISDREVISGKVKKIPQIQLTHADGGAFVIDWIDELPAMEQLRTLKALKE